MGRKSELIIPEETMRQLLNHPWASRVLPQIEGNWYRSRRLKQYFFQAFVPEHILQEFIETLEWLGKGQQD